MDVISGIVVYEQWKRYVYAIPLFYECYLNHELSLTEVDHPLDHTMTSNFTPDMLSCYAGFRIKSLNHGPRQWCSGLTTMTQVWICYITVL